MKTKSPFFPNVERANSENVLNPYLQWNIREKCFRLPGRAPLLRNGQFGVGPSQDFMKFIMKFAVLVKREKFY